MFAMNQISKTEWFFSRKKGI